MATESVTTTQNNDPKTAIVKSTQAKRAKAKTVKPNSPEAKNTKMKDAKLKDALIEGNDNQSKTAKATSVQQDKVE